jgi:hypothetical protein
MATYVYTFCSICGRELHTTFFCQECGQASCCLDCFCRHEVSHTRKQQEAQGEAEATRLEPAR